MGIDIEAAYDVRGLVARISSYDQATVGTGSVVNEVRSAYNDFAQPITSWQAHSGAVDTMSTPKVQYEYTDGSDNTIRPMAILYPNGRQLNYDYGSANGINDSLSRVAAIVEASSSLNLAQYQYLGAQAVVRIDSPQADLQYTLVDLTDTNDPETGDIYSGLDRFGRVKDVRWRNTDTATDLSRVQYGYNRASNRIWRKNPTDPNEQYDWLYTYDGLQRLKDAQRGTLNSTHTALSSQDFAQCWSLDATGNWQQFRQADEGSSWSLEQQRTANPVNEITGIENSVGPAWAQPAYDANGNMTTIPHPAGAEPLAPSSLSSSSEEIPAGFTATYDAWNRLIKLADAETAATVQENQYDGRYFRTLRKDYANGSLDQTRHFYYTDDWRCVEERLDTSTTPDRQFVWGLRYIDDLICRDRSTTGTLNERLYALPDGNWNVTALVNTSGSVTERLEYDPYGNTTWLTAGFVVEDESQFEWEVTYCSYRWEVKTSLFHVRFRCYQPRICVWMCKDPAWGGSIMSNYQYVKLCPLTNTDPFGLGKWQQTGVGSWHMSGQSWYNMWSSLTGKGDMFRDNYERGCIGVVCTSLGVSNPSLKNCYYGIEGYPRAKKKVSDMNSNNECCSSENCTNAYGGTPTARVIAFVMVNQDPKGFDPSEGKKPRPEIPFPENTLGPMDLSSYWHAIVSHPPGGGYNFDFFVNASTFGQSRWLHANHLEWPDAVKRSKDPMIVKLINEDTFHATINKYLKDKVFDTVYFCAECEGSGS